MIGTSVSEVTFVFIYPEAGWWRSHIWSHCTQSCQHWLPAYCGNPPSTVFAPCTYIFLWWVSAIIWRSNQHIRRGTRGSLLCNYLHWLSLTNARFPEDMHVIWNRSIHVSSLLSGRRCFIHDIWISMLLNTFLSNLLSFVLDIAPNFPLMLRRAPYQYDRFCKALLQPQKCLSALLLCCPLNPVCESNMSAA